MSALAAVEPTGTAIKFVNSASGKDSNSGTSSSPYKTLKQAYSALQSTGGTIYLQEAIDITGNITLTPSYWSNGSSSITLANGKSIQIRRAAGHTDDYLFHITGTLTLDGDITIGGNSVKSDCGFIEVDGGTLNLKSATLRNSIAKDYAGAVYVKSGTFNMSGGTISGCELEATGEVNGGAVAISAGTFNMTGGTIKNNWIASNGSDAWGGGVCNNGGTFNFKGGTITGNSAQGTGSSGGGWGGGIYNKATLNLSGGTVSDNVATSMGGGIYTTSGAGGTATCSGTVTISDNSASYGGGICIGGPETSSIFKSTSSSANLIIKNNYADVSGGGIFVRAAGILLFNSGTLNISNNDAYSSGGGIATTGVKDTVSATNSAGNVQISNATITNNNKTSGLVGSASKGGGIFIEAGTLRFNSGSITSNNANTGGGVHIGVNGTFSMPGGNITSNTSAGNGAGVYHNGKIRMSGGAYVHTNNVVYLCASKYIEVTAALSTNPAAAVTPNSYTLGRAVARAEYGTKKGSLLNDKFYLTPKSPYLLRAGDYNTATDSDMVISRTYTIYYYKNLTGSADGHLGNDTKYWGEPITVRSAPTDSTKEFLYWNTGMKGEGSIIHPGHNHTANADISFYGQWTDKKFTVTFDANGGTGGPVPRSASVGSTFSLPASNENPTRPGFTFKYWTGQKSADVLDENGKWYREIVVNGTYIKRIRLTRLNSKSIEVMVQASNTASVKAPTWTDPVQSDDIIWHGVGAGSWDRGGVKYNFGAQIHMTDHKKDINDYITHIYAYDANGNALQSANTGSAYDLMFSPGDTWYTDRDTTLYAQWEAKKINVTFHRNTSGSDSTTAKQSFTAGVPGQSFSAKGWDNAKPGYKIIGWSHDPNATTATYSLLSGVSDAWIDKYSPSTDLYAVWQPYTITVVYHSGDANSIKYNGTAISESTLVNNYTHTFSYGTTDTNGLRNGTNASALYMTKTGHRWKNTWAFGDANGNLNGRTLHEDTAASGKSLAAAAGVSIDKGNQTVHVYGLWDENILTVNYYSNGATESFADALNPVGEGKNVLVRTTQYTYNQACSDGLMNYTSPSNYTYLGRAGYTATGNWGTSTSGGTLVNQDTKFSNGGALAGALGTSLASGNATVNVYAQWKANQYTATFDANGGTAASPNTMVRNYGEELGTLPTTSNPGYTFIGWFADKEGGEKITPETKMPAKNVTYYAHWKAENTVKVVYNGNGASNGKSVSEKVTSSDNGDGYFVKQNKGFTDFERTNYSFQGWNFEADKSSATASFKKADLPYNITFEELMEKVSALTGEDLPTVELYAAWDQYPELYSKNDEVLRFYEGEKVTKEDLLSNIAAVDKEDTTNSKELDIRILGVKYAEGKIVASVKQPAYTDEWGEDMPDDYLLDTWYLQLDKDDSPVTHTIIYAVTDSAGNTTEFEWKIEVVYNEFPEIEAEDYYFTLGEAVEGKITKAELLKKVRAWDYEDCKVHCPDGSLEGNNCLSESSPCTFMTENLQVIGFDANAFLNYVEPGYEVVTYKVVDAYGKETIRQATIYIMDDGEIPEGPSHGKEVRFINQKNYEKNASVSADGLSYEELEALNQQAIYQTGGLRIGSLWYEDDAYVSTLTSIWTEGAGPVEKWSFDMEDAEDVREFVKSNGIGNSKRSDGLVLFRSQFGGNSK